MRGTLTVVSGPQAGRKMPVEDEISIGRDAGDLAIADPELSRRHAVIRRTDQGFVIADLGSTNGTIVNGERIDDPVTVTADTEIEVGDSKIKLEVIGAGVTRKSPAVTPPKMSADAPPAEAPRAGAGAGARARERRADPRLLLGLGVLVLVVIGVAVAVFALGEDTAGHDLDARVTALPLTDPASSVASGELRGDPLGRVAVVVQRSLGGKPRRGGRAVPLRSGMLVTSPDGNLSLNLTGTVSMTRAGGEVVRARGSASNGTGSYEGVSGTVRVSGGRADSDSPYTRLRVEGNLDY